MGMEAIGYLWEGWLWYRFSWGPGGGFGRLQGWVGVDMEVDN